MSALKLFLWPRGRLGRKGYGWALLFLVLAAVLISLANDQLGLLPSLRGRFYVALTCLYAWLCLTAKRLADSGWPPLLALLPAVALVAGLASAAFLVGALDGRAPAPYTMIGFFGPLAGILTFLGSTVAAGLASPRPARP